MLKLKNLLSTAITDESSSYREFARIAGSIISLSLAVGPISRLFTWQMHLAIESRSGWDQTFRFPAALLEELKFWYSNIGSFNSYSLRPPPDTSTVIFSDASDVAFGGFSASLDGLAATDMFTFDDLGQSSTFHELKAIYYVLLSFAGQLTHQRVKVFTDIQRVSRIFSEIIFYIRVAWEWALIGVHNVFFAFFGTCVWVSLVCAFGRSSSMLLAWFGLFFGLIWPYLWLDLARDYGLTFPVILARICGLFGP